MKALIKITEQNGKQAVSAKELYDFLGYALQHWSKWYNKNILSNEFAIENEDYTQLPQSGRSIDFAISVDFAKKISMMARTEKGEEARKYFIECEKQLKNNIFQLPQTYSEALRALADSEEQKQIQAVELKQAREVIEAQEPAVTFANSVKGSSNSILIRQFAKDLCDETFNIGQNRLFQWFRDNGYLNDKNEPYQNYIDMQVFEVVTRSIGSGLETFTSKTTKVTGKGQIYFARKIKGLKESA